ncbi:TolC family protein [Planctomycetota bacterium]
MQSRSVKNVMLFVLLTICLTMVGCGGRGDVKGKLDKNVYASIDRRWGEDMGSQANYRVSDVTPGPDDVNVAETISNLGTLTLPQAVALATAQNYTYQEQREALYLAGLDLRLTRHQFERRFFGVGGFGYSGNQDDELIAAEATAGFNHLLADGTEIGLSLTGAWVNVLTGDLQGGLASILGAAIRKPLLRGSNREIVLEGLTQAERDVLYQVRGFNRYRKQFVVTVISEYYRTLLLLDWAQNAQGNVTFLDSLYTQSQILYDYGRLNQIERDQIHQELLRGKSAALLTWKIYEQALDQFKRTLALNPSLAFKLDDRELERLKTASLTLPQVPDNEILNAALARRLDLINEADRIQDAQRKIAVAQDRMRGELNIVGSANGASRQVGDPRTLDPYENRANLGIEFDLPLDRVAEENAYRAALIAYNQQQRRYDDAADQIRLEVREAYRNLALAAERYQLQSKGLTLAEDRRRVSSLLAEHQRASTRRILQAQEDMVEAQNKRTLALINFAIASLDFYRDTGVLQVKPDGMWTL